MFSGKCSECREFLKSILPKICDGDCETCDLIYGGFQENDCKIKLLRDLTSGND